MKNEENNIQKAIVQYLRLKKILVFSVPNGQYIKNPVTRNIFKNCGLLSGVSDLIVVMYSRILFLEVKAPKKYQEPSQKEFEEEVKKRGFEYYVVRSKEDIDKII